MSPRNPSLPKPTGPGHNRPDLVCHHRVIYGLTCDQYEDMRARAAGVCPVCKIDEKDTPRGWLVIDHFHGSYYVPGSAFIRGLICDWCNQSVMQAHDGLKPWGKTNRQYREAAAEYERNSWQEPSEAALRVMAARTEMLPKRAKRTFDRSRVNAISIPSRQGVPAMAERLLAYLTPQEVGELAALLANQPEGATR